jgi:DNA-binding response OmpR family regulator
MARILLLEPDRLLARSYSKSLESKGYSVHWINDAQAALGILDEHQIDLVVLELQLTGHNGVEFLYEFRSYPDWDHIPVILHTMVPDTHPGVGKSFWEELGIVEYRYKPQTSLKQLAERVAVHSSVVAL